MNIQLIKNQLEKGLNGCSKGYRGISCSMVQTCGGNIVEGKEMKDECDPNDEMVRINNLFDLEKYKKLPGNNHNYAESNFKIVQGNYYRNVRGANFEEDKRKYLAGKNKPKETPIKNTPPPKQPVVKPKENEKKKEETPKENQKSEMGGEIPIQPIVPIQTKTKTKTKKKSSTASVGWILGALFLGSVFLGGKNKKIKDKK